MTRCLVFIALSMFAALSGLRGGAGEEKSAKVSETPKPAPPSPLKTFFDSHCIHCHDAATKKGGLDVATLSGDFKDPAMFDKWVKVHDRVRAGDMPPKSRKERPTAQQSDAFLKHLQAALTNAERTLKAGSGRADFRRLNRSEYENTLRDLLSLSGLQVKDLLPEDGRAFGYDKSASGLDLSHVQLSKYLEAADFALDAATAPHAARPDVYQARIFPGSCGDFTNVATNGDAVLLKDFKYDPVFPIVKDDVSRPKVRDLLDAKKFPYHGAVGVFRHEDCAFRPRFTPFAPSYSGMYRLKLSVWSFFWEKGEVKANARTEAASLVANGRLLGYFDAPSLKPTVHEIDVWLNASEEIYFNAASLWHVRVSERKGKAAEYVGPGIAIDFLDIEGPLLDHWPPASHQSLYANLPLAPFPKGALSPNDPRLPRRTPIKAIRGFNRKPIEYGSVVSAAPEADATRLLKVFLKRAFRRPVPEDDVRRYVGLFKAQLAEGAGFEVALRTAYRAALCSPNFLYLKEPAGRLDQWAMASRLSYFLWNSMPDDELFALAEKNKLFDKTVLREQVERMLKDPKSTRFVVDFTDQWLDLREIDATCPDRRLYPEFRPILRDAMLAESQAFFHELLDKDLSVSNVVHSDFTLVNQRLAEHYRLPGVEGTAIRRVELAANSHRGGLLTHASVLKVTANGTTTSPVKRGAWVQRKILGQPPEPPPPDVPAIEPDVRGTTTIREMLDKHRANASCAACHAKIDPPGFALENYDVIGGWQTRYRSLGAGDIPDPATTGGRGVGYRLALKVDAAGETADGRAFTDVEDFKKLLCDDPRPLARNLVVQLVIYATGAPVGFADRPAVEQVLDKSAPGRYGVRSLIHEIAESTLFQMK